MLRISIIWEVSITPELTLEDGPFRWDEVADHNDRFTYKELSYREGSLIQFPV